MDIWKIVPSCSGKWQGDMGTSEASLEIWYVHPTYMGFVCPVHTPEGGSVGLVKQLAITAIVSCETDST